LEHAKILVVDDSISIVVSLCKILELSGYEVDPAYNGSDALRKIAQKNYDLIICDIEMPGITSLDFLGRVRQEFGDSIDVILMTGFLDQDYFVKAICLGAADFIRKPVNPKLIIHSIKEIINRKRERSDISDFVRYLDETALSFVIDPKNFNKFSISKVLSHFLSTNFRLPLNVMNELLICIDEMIFNAFIHGTLKLRVDERFIDSESFQKLVNEKLCDPQVAQKRIRFSLRKDKARGDITMEVEDDGDGFNHEAWLKRIKTDQSLNIDEHGRGLSLLYHLSDELHFANEGRKVCVRKKVDDAPPTE